MSETFRTTPPDQQWSGTNAGANGHQGAFDHEPEEAGDGEVGKALLVGVLGGLVSAAGYFVYRRLPEEQKEKLHAQVRTMVAQRITELRQNFNL
ncbi:MAG TPA: hypothetical protein VIK27_09485 [Candidatus Aquilonibacter sp.]